MKRLVLALALMCALSATTIAGEIPSTGITSPPPPPASAVMTVILKIISIVAG